MIWSLYVGKKKKVTICLPATCYNRQNADGQGIPNQKWCSRMNFVVPCSNSENKRFEVLLRKTWRGLADDGCKNEEGLTDFWAVSPSSGLRKDVKSDTFDTATLLFVYEVVFNFVFEFASLLQYLIHLLNSLWLLGGNIPLKDSSVCLNKSCWFKVVSRKPFLVSE